MSRATLAERRIGLRIDASLSAHARAGPRSNSCEVRFSAPRNSSFFPEIRPANRFSSDLAPIGRETYYRGLIIGSNYLVEGRGLMNKPQRWFRRCLLIAAWGIGEVAAQGAPISLAPTWAVNEYNNPAPNGVHVTLTGQSASGYTYSGTGTGGLPGTTSPDSRRRPKVYQDFAAFNAGGIGSTLSLTYDIKWNGNVNPRTKTPRGDLALSVRLRTEAKALAWEPTSISAIWRAPCFMNFSPIHQ